MIKKLKKDDANWVPLDLKAAIFPSECAFQDSVLQRSTTFDAWWLPMMPLLGLQLGKNIGDWRLSIDLVTRDFRGQFLGYTISSLSSRVNSVLNNLFGLPADQVSIFNLSPLLPISRPWALVINNVILSEPVLVEPQVTTIIPSASLWGEVSRQETILPIDIQDWFRIPDMGLFPYRGNSVVKNPIPLVDFLIYEIRESRFDQCLWKLELDCISDCGKIEVKLDFHKAVKLGSNWGVGIYCVPFLTESVYEIRKPADFVRYLKKAYAHLNDNERKKQFTTFTDAFPNSDPTDITFHVNDIAALSIYMWYVL